MYFLFLLSIASADIKELQLDKCKLAWENALIQKAGNLAFLKDDLGNSIEIPLTAGTPVANKVWSVRILKVGFEVQNSQCIYTFSSGNSNPEIQSRI